jgi:hypothetical protein
MKKWKWPLMNVWECKSLISTAMEFLTPPMPDDGNEIHF